MSAREQVAGKVFTAPVGAPARAGARGGHVLRTVAAGIGAAAAAGLLVSVPARVLMRLVALAAGHETHFTLAVSVGIAVVFALAVLPGALVAAATQRRRRFLPLALGTALLLVSATGIASDELTGTAGLSALRWAALAVSGLAVYACILVLPLLTLRLADRFAGRLPAQLTGPAW